MTTALATRDAARAANVNAPHVYQAMAAVMADLGKDGIGKNRKNQSQGYNFRGVDDVYNALSSTLSDHSLCVIPRMLSREMTERETQKGGVLFNVVVSAEFDFVSAVDGSTHKVGPFYGEAMDSGDKATNKAMSAAYKYMAFQTFCIPTEGDNDADAATHEVKPRTSASQLKKGKAWDSFVDRVQGFEEAGDLEGLKAWYTSAEVTERVAQWPQAWREQAEEEFEKAHDRIKKADRA